MSEWIAGWRNRRRGADARRLEAARKAGLVILKADTYAELADLERRLGKTPGYRFTLADTGDHWRAYRAAEDR